MEEGRRSTIELRSPWGTAGPAWGSPPCGRGRTGGAGARWSRLSPAPVTAPAGPAGSRGACLHRVSPPRWRGIKEIAPPASDMRAERSALLRGSGGEARLHAPSRSRPHGVHLPRIRPCTAPRAREARKGDASAAHGAAGPEANAPAERTHAALAPGHDGRRVPVPRPVGARQGGQGGDGCGLHSLRGSFPRCGGVPPGTRPGTAGDGTQKVASDVASNASAQCGARTPVSPPPRGRGGLRDRNTSGRDSQGRRVYTPSHTLSSPLFTKLRTARWARRGKAMRGSGLGRALTRRG